MHILNKCKGTLLMNYKFYKDRFREFRKNKKISQADIGKAIQKSRNTIINWERGTHTPSSSDIREIAVYMDIALDEISDLQEIKKSKRSPIAFNDNMTIEIEELFNKNVIPQSLVKKFSDLKNMLIDTNAQNTRLRRRLERHDFLLQNLPFMIYTKRGDDLKYKFVNDAFLVLIGQNISKEEVIGSGSLSFFGRHDCMPILELEQRVVNDKEKITGMPVTIPGTRGERVGLLNIIPIIEGSNVSEIICSIKDITDSYKDEKARKEMEAAVNNLNQLIWIGYRNNPNDLSEPITYTYINDSCENYWNIPRKPLFKGEYTFFKYIHPDDKEIFDKWHFSSYPKKIECRVIIDGILRYISVHAYNDGSIFWGIVNDITDSSIKIKSFAHNEIILKYFDLVTDAIWLVESTLDNKSMETVYVNKAREELYELSGEEMKINSLFWINAMHPDDRIRISEEFYNHTSGVIEQKYRLLMPDGTVKYIEESIYNTISGKMKYCFGVQCVIKIVNKISDLT